MIGETVAVRRARVLEFEAEVMAQLVELELRRAAADRLRGPFAWIARRIVDRGYRRRWRELQSLLIGARRHLGDLDRLHGPA